MKRARILQGRCLYILAYISQKVNIFVVLRLVKYAKLTSINMNEKKKVLVFCVPFSGHLHAIKEMMHRLKDDYQFTLVITSWKNIPADLENDLAHISLEHSELHETDPAIWTLSRVAELLPDCLALAGEFEPDLIVYDYFSPEGYFVGKMLGIPYWSSIPAMIGPFQTQEYLSAKLQLPLNQTAIEKIEAIYSHKIDREKIEMISDGLHFPGELNILWSYQDLTPSDYLLNRTPGSYVFIGGAKAEKIQSKQRQERPLVYFSFGTVVMNNLWNQQPLFQPAFRKFIGEVAERWADKKIDVVFVCQGKKILETYPKNWQVVDHADQMEMLAKADVFVTHGGGNSFNEAVINHVPMVVIPFFGDQILISEQIERLGIGKNLGKDSDIDTKKSKQFLGKELGRELDEAVFGMLATDSYARQYEKFSFQHVSLHALFSDRFPL